MFRKPQVTVSLSRQPKTAEDTITPEAIIAKIDWTKIQETVKTTAKVAVASYAAKVLIDTTSQIAVNAASAQFK